MLDIPITIAGWIIVTYLLCGAIYLLEFVIERFIYQTVPAIAQLLAAIRNKD